MSLLVGSKVKLRDYEKKDIPFFLSIRNNISLQHSLMAHPRKNNENDVINWLEKRTYESDTVFFVIADALHNTACGFIQLIKIDTENKHAWLGICVDEESQGKSFAYEALSCLERFSMTTMGLNKILLEVLSNNARAIGFYHRYGFREVGILEDHHMIKGHFHNVLLMEKRLKTG